ncbi:MAG: M23 family metallopeptidase, partial [Bacteroidetes bacterium]|nr:M23 family metallopeptidase [Bacteroidota bacterium]
DNGITHGIWKALGFLCAAVIFAIAIVFVAFNYFDSPKEKQLKRELAKLNLQYELMGEKLEQMDNLLTGLQDKDDNIYRVIFGEEPIPMSVREVGYGGSNRYRDLENYDNGELMISTTKKLEKVRRKLYIQSKSYDEIFNMIQNKEKMLSSIPAIQPVANKNLRRMASGFGYRIDPIYKTKKFHKGIDFTAPRGTKIYATGNGVVVETKKNRTRRGYGNFVIIDHGYGYETLYAHMSRTVVRRGMKVRRGDVIGYIGSTGKSTAPHLHYEVIKDGHKVDPINFFYNDLNPAEFEKMLELASRYNQSFD